jgi:hypothetical protein
LFCVLLFLGGFVLSGCSAVDDAGGIDDAGDAGGTIDEGGAGDAGGTIDAGPSVCGDSDSDTDSCDHCAVGQANPAEDGPDSDGDGVCDAGDDDRAPGGWTKPGPHNTGPTAPDLPVPSGSISVREDGAVIENIFVSGTINVEAADVTIRNFKIDGGGDAIKTTGNNLVESSWVHHLGMKPGSHADGNQTRSGDDIVFRRNFMDMPIPESPAGPSAPFNSHAAGINDA